MFILRIEKKKTKLQGYLTRRTNSAYQPRKGKKENIIIFDW